MKRFYAKTFKDDQGMAESEIINAVHSDELFIFVECNSIIPPELEPSFLEMPPMFENVKLSREYLSESMRAFAVDWRYLVGHKHSLVGSMKDAN